MSRIIPLTPVDKMAPTKERNLVQEGSFPILRNICVPTDKLVDSKPPEFAISFTIEVTESDLIS
jgi:hypothetical protein